VRLQEGEEEINSSAMFKQNARETKTKFANRLKTVVILASREERGRKRQKSETGQPGKARPKTHA